jgi:hypothetical protein
MPPKPLCFVLMPFGRKKDLIAERGDIDFDHVYQEGVAPAIDDAGLEPVRADMERTGGVIHTAMFERLLLCDFAVADLTCANGNVLYELGVRHATRPRTTLPIFAKHQALPFDLNFLRAMPYDLGDHNRFAADEAKALRTALARRLADLRNLAAEQESPDSPLFTVLAGYQAPDLAHLKTDDFHKQVEYSQRAKSDLAAARRLPHDQAVASLLAFERELPIDIEAGVVIDLYLSYRAVEEWTSMVGLYNRMPIELKRTVLVREQFAFALNRLGERDHALQILDEVLQERGANPETCGLMGRIYEDKRDEALGRGDAVTAAGLLRKAITTYQRGFEADWRDAYPGINALTLLEIEGKPKSLAERDRLLPVVRFSAEARLRGGATTNYWDHATLLELAVVASDQEAAGERLADALAAEHEPWMPKTTANNLKKFCEARATRGEAVNWIEEIIRALEKT